MIETWILDESGNIVPCPPDVNYHEWSDQTVEHRRLAHTFLHDEQVELSTTFVGTLPPDVWETGLCIRGHWIENWRCASREDALNFHRLMVGLCRNLSPDQIIPVILEMSGREDRQDLET